MGRRAGRQDEESKGRKEGDEKERRMVGRKKGKEALEKEGSIQPLPFSRYRVYVPISRMRQMKFRGVKT